MSMAWYQCRQCKQMFFERPMLQQEARFAGIKYGQSEAHTLVQETLEDEHRQHVVFHEADVMANISWGANERTDKWK